MAAQRTVTQARATYATNGDWTGMTPSDFEDACRAHIIHGVDTTPQDWADASDAVCDEVYETLHGLGDIQARQTQADDLYNRDYGVNGALRG